MINYFMKCILLIAFFILSGVKESFPQTWNLFPQGQTSLYQTKGGWETIRIDSVKQDSITHIYFNPRVSDINCEIDTLLISFFSNDYFLIPDQSQIDSNSTFFVCFNSGCVELPFCLTRPVLFNIPSKNVCESEHIGHFVIS